MSRLKTFLLSHWLLEIVVAENLAAKNKDSFYFYFSQLDIFPPSGDSALSIENEGIRNGKGAFN